MGKEKKDKDVRSSELIGYGLFGFGANCVGGILGSFLTLYLTDNLLLSTAFIAGLMLVGRITNAISETLMGYVIDRTHTKIGKARPWILGSAFMTAFPVFMVFNTPAGLGDLGVKIWTVVSYLLHVTIFGAAISVAVSTLLVKISKRQETRTKMTNLSNLLGQIAALIASSTGIPILMHFGGYATGYKWLSLIFSAVGFAAMFLTGVLCKEKPDAAAVDSNREIAPETAKRKQPREPLKVQIGYVFKNKYAFFLAAIFVLFQFAVVLMNSVTVYYTRDVMGNAGYMAQISYAKIIPIIVIGLLGIVPLLTSKFGMKNTLMIGAALLFAGCLVMTLSSESLAFICVGNVLFGAGTAFYGALMGATVADVADYVNLKNKTDVSGMVSSISYIGMRIGMAFGSVGIMVALEVGKYNAEAANSGLAQASSALLAEKMCYIYIPAICCGLLILCSKFLDADQEVKRMRAGQEVNA